MRSTLSLHISFDLSRTAHLAAFSFWHQVRFPHRLFPVCKTGAEATHLRDPKPCGLVRCSTRWRTHFFLAFRSPLCIALFVPGTSKGVVHTRLALLGKLLVSHFWRALGGSAQLGDVSNRLDADDALVADDNKGLVRQSKAHRGRGHCASGQVAILKS